MSMPGSANSSKASARSAKPGCCCSRPSSSPTNCPTPTRRCSRSAAAAAPPKPRPPTPSTPRPSGDPRHRPADRGHCGAAGDPLACQSRGGAARRVRPHVTPGPIPTSWVLSLSRSWPRYMAPTCYGGPRWDCKPTAEAAPPYSRSHRCTARGRCSACAASGLGRGQSDAARASMPSQVGEPL